MTTPTYIDATMLLPWKHLAPVGVVRLERLLCAKVRFSPRLQPVHYVVFDRGYRLTTPAETADLDALLGSQSLSLPDDPATSRQTRHDAARRKLPIVARVKGSGRAATNKLVDRMPISLRAHANNAIYAPATFLVEGSRLIKRRIAARRGSLYANQAKNSGTARIFHQVDFSTGGDLICLGLGWEYLDHEAMYFLKQLHGIRIHMPAFDLICIDTPQFNSGQRHPVHRYYAEMGHYADTITCISEATEAAIRAFYEREDLPLPFVTTNPLPGIPPDPSFVAAPARAPFDEEPFVLSVSTIEIRKNHLLLAKLWAELIRQGHDMPHMVLVGRVGWDVDELMRWIDFAPELRGKFHLLADVEDDELLSLYDRCLFTLFPSRAEGWGLPITESLMRGKVCVHSTDPAQIEAAQGIMPAFHPDDFLGWKAEIIRLLENPDQVAALEQRIANEYHPRSPEEYGSAFEALIASRKESAE